LAVAVAAVMALGSAYGVHASHIDWTSMLVATLVGPDAGQASQPDAAAPPDRSVPTLEVRVPDAPAPDAAVPEPAVPVLEAPAAVAVVADSAVELPGPGCIPLSTATQRRIRADSAVHRRRGCYTFDLVPDVDGCAEVTAVQKLGSSSNPEYCDGSAPSSNTGSLQEGVHLLSSRSSRRLVVGTTVGSRHYDFVLHEGRDQRLHGDFTSEITGRPAATSDPDQGTLVEVP